MLASKFQECAVVAQRQLQSCVEPDTSGGGNSRKAFSVILIWLAVIIKA